VKLKSVEFESRDLLIVVPALGVVISVTWEVGKFTAFGAFSLFSLSDHVMGALQALPLALLLALGTTVIAGRTIQPPAPRSSDKPPVRGFKRALAIIAIYSLAAVWFAVGFFAHLAIILAAGLLLVAIVTLAIFQATAMYYGAALAAGLLIITIAAGNDVARSEMEAASRTPPELLETLETKSGEHIQGRTLMSGERGMLFYQPNTNEITFVRSDDIKSLKRQRAGIFSYW
jgi:hypothetical protein